MSIKNKIIFTSLITVFAIILPKSGVQAAFLPNCDQSCYNVTRVVASDGEKAGTRAATCIKDASDYLNKPQFVVELSTTKKCDFNDFVQLLLNLTSWGLGALGVLALFFFVYGGFNLLISAGRAEKVQEAKNILKGTFIGLILVLVAWQFVAFYVMAFAGSEYVFPNTPEFMKKWWSSGQDCRSKYKESCNINNLHEGCGDGSGGQGNVSKLQQALINSGCNCGSGGPDGCFGPNTKSCLKAFQAANSLKVDGIAGVETWAALNAKKLCDKYINDMLEQLKSQELELEPRGSIEPSDMGCWVPEDSKYGCIDAIGGASSLLESENAADLLFKYVYEDKPCDNIPSCSWGCCYKPIAGAPDGRNFCRAMQEDLITTCNDWEGLFKTGGCGDWPELKCVYLE